MQSLTLDDMDSLRASVAALRDGHGSIVPATRTRLLVGELQTIGMVEVTDVETLSTFVDGTRSATALIISGHGPQGIAISRQPDRADGQRPDRGLQVRRIRGFGSHLAFIWDKNLVRLLIVLAVLTALVAANGTVQVVQMLFGLIGAGAGVRPAARRSPLTYIIFQFGILFWFLSRPRKYTVTPDDPQIGMSFENYRGQPDLLEHAKTTVGILRGVKEFELRGGEMPKGMLLSGAPGHGQDVPRRACIASEANLPFIYIDASSLQRHVHRA